MKIALLGAGLIGGSVGLALKQRVPEAEVSVYDRSDAASREAVARRAADRAAGSVEEAVEGANVVFIATPVSVIPSVAREAAARAPRGAVLTDVGSTKLKVVLDAEAEMPAGVSFIGGHPMAGSEAEGIGAARGDLFEGAWWILTPTERTDPGAYQQLHALISALGARIMALHPAEHDELLALISHLPQLVATTLMNVAAERGREHAGLLALAAGGFRDVTRVAASNPEIWVDICDENRGAITAALKGFVERLETLRGVIGAGRREEIRAMLLSAREARRALPVKGEHGDLYEVRVPIPDRPGVLSEVTTLVGNLGINIEDLELTHAAEGGQGFLRLAVFGQEAADRVAKVLEGSHYQAVVTLL